MKTSMQFLKEEIQNKLIPPSKENGELSEYQYSHNVAYGTVLTIIEYLLEKEKEQIIDFHVMLMKKGLEQEGNKIEWDYDELKKEAEEYYNQTYNQEETLEE